ncbi:MAG: beta-lactamase family protein, partial [Gemmataceae bacterium]|nr:beta-lactamase family protein [Gemmataceae bacterium]
APALSPKQIMAADAAAKAALERDKLVGLAYGLIHGGRVAHTAGLGLADREAGVPVSTQTRFRWASVSKPLTAVAAMQLVQKGLLGLDDDVRKYVPEFPDKGEKITVRHLLCHQSGIVHYANGKVVKRQRDYTTPHPFADVVTALDTFCDSPLIHPPGAKYSYTTHGYMLLSAVVERAGKKPFAEQVQERIAKPLGLETLRPDYQWEEIPWRAIGYRKLNGNEIHKSSNTDVSWKLGGGGYISTIDDFAGFAAGLTRHTLVDAATERLIWAPQNLADGKATNYGLGFGVATDKAGRLRVSHSGSQEKTRTMLVIFPREQTGVVVMTNSEWANPGQIAMEILSAVTGEPPAGGTR